MARVPDFDSAQNLGAYPDMKPAFWKWLVLVQSVCIAGMIAGGAWWIRETKNRTRIATLRALYEYLKPAPPDDRIWVPVVLDLTVEQGECRRYLHGQLMDKDQLSVFARQIAEVGDPIIVRPAPDISIQQVVATLGLLTASGNKFFILSFKNETLALTDRNLTPEGATADLVPVPVQECK